MGGHKGPSDPLARERLNIAGCIAQDKKTFAGRIGAEIRGRRERKKLTVEQAAMAAGAPTPTWYHWEIGRHLPLDRLPAIAKSLGCTVRDLIPRD